MGATTGISWASATWNPWRGCDKVSPGCAECFMFREQRRYGRDPETVTRCADSTFYAPLKTKKWRELPAGSFVFTCSWSDFFHPAADEWRDEAWEVIRQRPDLRWLVLTKRPEYAHERLPDDWGEGWLNVMLGVSIELRRFVYRADELRMIPAAGGRFISAEPLLGPLMDPPTTLCDCGQGPPDLPAEHEVCVECGEDPPCDCGLDLTDIDWLIAGGESGGRLGRALVDVDHRPKPEALDWMCDLRDACLKTGVAFHLKQWGGPRSDSGGRELDGREWSEFPEPVERVGTWRATDSGRLYQHRCTECGLTSVGPALPIDHHPHALKEAVPVENPTPQEVSRA